MIVSLPTTAKFDFVAKANDKTCQPNGCLALVLVAKLTAIHHGRNWLRNQSQSYCRILLDNLLIKNNRKDHVTSKLQDQQGQGKNSAEVIIEPQILATLLVMPFAGSLLPLAEPY